MAVRDWLRPPRHLVVLFLGIALILMATLAGLGWRLFQQDRALEQQRVQVRLEHAADIVVAGFARRMGEIEDRLNWLASLAATDLPDSAAAYAEQFCGNTVVLAVETGVLSAYPRDRLAYYPVVPTTEAPDPRRFAEGETLEFRRQDFAGAATVYRQIARTKDPATRAGALVRLARTERKAGRLTAALDAYDQLATMGPVSVTGQPADLVARHASLGLLQDLQRADSARSRANTLHADLVSGRWMLTRAQYEFYVSDVCAQLECAGADDAAEAKRTALAAGAEWLWNGGSVRAGGGQEMHQFGNEPVLVVWHSLGGRVTALVGGSVHLTADWLGALAPVLTEQSVETSLADVSGNDVTAPVGSDLQLVVTRTVADTRLPWALHVASADPAADFAQLRERRRLMLLGVATLALFVAVGLYAVMHGVSRELEIARLQSDFVAAVSHEFRTPLTSLRQLAELLSSGRVASEERRSRYYHVMERETARLHRLVEGLLNFGRMEAGALEFNWDSVEPGELVGSVVADFEAERGEGGCHVEFTIESTSTPVRADSEALGRAVWNLMDNAAKYSPDCRTIWVRVSRQDGRVAITVRDEGVGIATGERKAIFGKFVRGTSSDGRGIKGTGIGLAMVQHIVEAHGGEVRVESELGSGSTFTILLPVEG